jgi:hypothetical protein
MASYTLSPVGGAGAQFFDNNGNPLSGGKLYTYAAGTTTPLTTWTTPAGTVANTNPIILDSAGRPPQEIWLSVLYTYKFQLKTSADVLIATYDNIPGLPQPAVTNNASTIYYEQGNTVTAGSFVIGRTYMIATLGTTDFTAIGATANSVGQIFVATGVGSGTGTAYNSQTVQAKLQQTISVTDFGATGDGTTNDTAAIQAAIIAAKNDGVPGVSVGVSLYFPAGIYAITGLIIYPFQHLIFDPGAVLKMTASGIAIRTSSVQAQVAPTGNITRVLIDNPRIDMNNQTGFGLLLECCTNAVVNNAQITNVAAATFQYSDGYDPVGTTWASIGIVLKGITDTYGCYYNSVNNCRINSFGSTATSNAGIWLGTSRTGENQRANFNQINQAVCLSLATGIDVALGGDNFILQPEMSLCDVGIRVGNIADFSSQSNRTWIQQPYLESCTTAGIQLRSNAQDTVIQGFGGLSGTSTIVDDSGETTSIFASNTDSAVTNGYTRFYYGSVRFPGIQIPDADVNALDDYQEGSFTPRITCLGTAPTSVTYVTQFGKYTKIGNVVMAQLNLEWSAMAGSPAGQMAIDNLPFAPFGAGAITAIFPASSVGGTGGAFVTGLMASTGEIRMYKFDGTNNVTWDFDPAAQIRCSITYFTDS